MGEAKDAADTPLAIGYGYLNSDGFLKDIQRGRAPKSARLYDIRIIVYIYAICFFKKFLPSAQHTGIFWLAKN